MNYIMILKDDDCQRAGAFQRICRPRKSGHDRKTDSEYESLPHEFCRSDLEKSAALCCRCCYLRFDSASALPNVAERKSDRAVERA